MTVSTEKEQPPASAEEMRDIQLSVLKELVDDPNVEVKTLAEELDLPYQTVNGIIMDFVRAMVHTYGEVNWPDRVRGLFNKDVEDRELRLTTDDMNILKSLVTRFHKKKLEKIERVKPGTQAKKAAGGQQGEVVVYTDTYTNPQPQPPQPQQRPPTQEEYMKSMGFNLPQVPYMDAITLMKF